MMKPFFFLSAIALLGLLSCGTPECVKCQNVQGYPDAVICRDSYETASGENTPSWKEYSSQAISAGCVATE